MKKILKKFLIFLPLILLLLFVILVSFFKKIPLNDSTVTGNTAGNLNNKGLFCEKDGKVYFANAYDHDTLYVMNPDETKYKKLGNVSVSSLNVDDNRIYYSQTGIAKGSGLGYLRNSVGLYSCKKKGGHVICYTKDPTAIAALSGNDLYFQHQTKTKTTTDKVHIRKDEIQVSIDDFVSPASVVPAPEGNIIYYNGMKDDHYLYALDTVTNAPTMIWEHNLYHPVYQNGYIYFMDLKTDYELHSYNLSTGEEKVLSTDRLDYFNVYDSVIYYQTCSLTDPALKRIYIDGTGDTVVKDGVYESVNITSHYAYFNEFKKPTPVYHQSTYGEIHPEIFQPEILQ